MEKSFVLIVLLFAALATGGLIVNWIGFRRAMSRLTVSTYVEFHQHTNNTFDPYMPIVIIGALVGGVALAAMYGVYSIPGQLAAAGAVCYALVIIIGYPHVSASTIKSRPGLFRTHRPNGLKRVRDGFDFMSLERYSPFRRSSFISLP
jgi:hypothetical protein